MVAFTPMTAEMRATSEVVGVRSPDEDEPRRGEVVPLLPIPASKRALLREALADELLELVEETGELKGEQAPPALAASSWFPGAAGTAAPPAATPVQPAPSPADRLALAKATARGVVGTVFVCAMLWMLGVAALLPGGPSATPDVKVVTSTPPVVRPAAPQAPAPGPPIANPPAAAKPEPQPQPKPKPAPAKAAKPSTPATKPAPKRAVTPKSPAPASAKPPVLPAGLDTPAGPRRLAWAPVSGVSRYDIQLFRGNTLVFSGTSKTASYELRKRLEPGTYLWYVWPVRNGIRDSVAVVRASLKI